MDEVAALRQQVADLQAVIRTHERTEQALRASEHRYRGLLESQHDLIVRVDPYGRFTFVNDAYCKKFAKRRQELLGVPSLSFVTAEEHPTTREALKGLTRPPYRVEMERQALTAEGWRWLAWEVYAIRDEKDRIVEMQAVGRDITDRKEAEHARHKSEERHRAIINAALDAVITMDSAGLITGWNPQAERIFGWAAHEVLGQPLVTTLVPFRYHGAHERGVKRFFTTGEGMLLNQRTEIRALHKDGHEFPVELAISAIRAEDTWLFSAFVRDITERQRLEEELQDSEERYRSLYENANDAIVTFTLEGIVTSVNRGLEAMLGWSRAELIGQHYRKFVTPASVAVGEERTRRFLAGERQPSIFEGEHVTKEGRVVPVEVRTRPIRDRAGQPVGFQGIYRDLTERKRAEEAVRRSAEHFRALVEHALDFVVVLTREGTIRYESPAMARLLGYTPEERVGRNGFEHIHPADRPQVLEAFTRLLQSPGATAALEFRIRHKDGAWRTLEAVGTNLLAEAAVAGVVVNCRDTTERTRMEEELRQTKEAAEAANRAKSEFLATMSHELRTPLGIILGYTDLLLEKTFGPLSERQAEPLRRIARSARELHDLISAVLDLSRLEAGRLPLGWCETQVGTVLQEVQAETRGLQEQTPLSFVWEVEEALPVLYTDPGKLKIVLKNLIGNAVKFTPNGSITVVARGQPEGVEVRVTDTGIGIPQEALGAIFEPFRQLEHAATRHNSGTGLGLHIVKRLLEVLGGTITVESEVGRGSTFLLWLPRAGNSPAR
jgi:PAS domain S-box-containing protein